MFLKIILIYSISGCLIVSYEGNSSANFGELFLCKTLIKCPDEAPKLFQNEICSESDSGLIEKTNIEIKELGCVTLEVVRCDGKDDNGLLVPCIY